MPSLRIPWLCLPLAYWASACGDNVGCVFVDGCTGSGGVISDNQAVAPVDGEWVLDGPPTVLAVFPSGAQNEGSTPIVILFSESIAPQTALGAVEVAPLAGGGLPGPPVLGLIPQLVSDGRVLVILPAPGNDLQPGDYIVRLSADSLVTDLTGQELDKSPGSQLGVFTVVATPPPGLHLVMAFPRDGASNQSETTQIVAVFDRPAAPQSVTPLSFDVKVDGADPADDPPAVPIRLGSAGITDTRVYLYRSVDGQGVPAPFGASKSIELRLSQGTNTITDTDGDDLAATTIRYQTLPLSPPTSASFASEPHDAIGLANLTDGDPQELVVDVELDAAQTDDSVDLILFGTQKTVQENAPLIALQRSIKLTAPGPIDLATFLREDVPLQTSNAPDDVRFKDGALTFAFRMRRGSAVTPVRVLDLDPDPDIIQDPVLDTTRPTVQSLAGSTTADAFRSDLRDLSLAGKADESLRSVEVTTPLGGNGAVPPVVGSRSDGSFLAAPVLLDVLAGGSTAFTFAARDHSLNSSPPKDGVFTQLGVVGPDPWTSGADIEVEVFDATTLLPLQGALVLLHTDQGNGVDFPLHGSGSTQADGKVTLGTDPVAPAAIVTVVAAGHDLFTLHGVPSTHLSVPLRPTRQAPALATGVLTSEDAATVALLPNLDLRFDDSRLAPELPRGFTGDDPIVAQGVLTSTYGPQPIRAGRLGARSFYAGDFLQTESSFSAAQLLQAFTLTLPFLPPLAGGIQPGELRLDFLLLDTTIPPAEAAQALPAFVLHADPAGGVDLGNLFDDLSTTGEPCVSVDVLVPGLPASLGVGVGLAFPVDGQRWTIRTAMPGAITAGGSLGSQGAVDTDPFVRAEVRDLVGNTAGVRPRLSTLLAAGGTPELLALTVPTQLSPAAGAETGSQEFTLLLRHAIDDTRPEGGLYKVELFDPTGRGWTLWRFDGPGSSDVLIRVVDVAAAGGTGLADGPIASTVSAYAWNGLVPTDFLWTDVERRFELFSRAAPLDFFKPVKPPAPRLLAPTSSSRSRVRAR